MISTGHSQANNMLNNAHLSIGSTAVQSLKCIFACKVDHSDSYLEISLSFDLYFQAYVSKNKLSRN